MDRLITMPSTMPRVARALAALLLGVATLAPAAQPASAQQALETALTAWVAAQSGVQPEQVKMSPLDARIQIQPCAGSLSFDYPFVNRENVRARCSKPTWQMFVKVGFTQQPSVAEMILARRDLPPGHVLADADLDIKPTAVAPPGSFADRTPLTGRQLKRPLAKGQPVLVQDLDKSQKALRARVALKAGDLLTESAIERIDLPPGGGASPPWMANELAPGLRMAKSLAAGQILQAGDVAESRQVVVAASNLGPGQVIKLETLKLERLDAEKISKTHLFELAGLENFELMRPIRAGEALRSSDLRAALMVKKGELVSLVIGRPPEFMISVKVEALQDGRLNEQIKLRNTESGHTLSGIVTGKGAARGI